MRLQLEIKLNKACTARTDQTQTGIGLCAISIRRRICMPCAFVFCRRQRHIFNSMRNVITSFYAKWKTSHNKFCFFFLLCASYSSERYAFQNAMALCTHVCNHILYKMWIRRAEWILQICAILVHWIRGKCQREKIQFLIRSLVLPLPLICSFAHGIFCMLNIYMYIISLCIFSSYEVSACIKHIICQAEHLSTLPNQVEQRRQWTCAAIIIMVIEYKK